MLPISVIELPYFRRFWNKIYKEKDLPLGTEEKLNLSLKKD